MDDQPIGARAKGRQVGDQHVGKAKRFALAGIAAPAFVATWSGWVGLGEKVGFGPVTLLPGIADDWQVNTAITLPLGIELYAAYALGVWLSSRAMSNRTRDFARISGLTSLGLGALGQVAYHLLVAFGMRSAPWLLVAGVACLPIAIVGMTAALIHMQLADDLNRRSSVPDNPAGPTTSPVNLALPDTGDREILNHGSTSAPPSAESEPASTTDVSESPERPYSPERPDAVETSVVTPLKQSKRTLMFDHLDRFGRLEGDSVVHRDTGEAITGKSLDELFGGRNQGRAVLRAWRSRPPLASGE